MGDGSIFGAILPLLLMFAIFYFLLIRPQQKRQKKVREMHAALQKGDKIVTIGGLHGKIDAIDENLVVIDIGSTKLTFDRQAIREVTNQD
ncbi:preprotein translocase subunit YajC [Evansella tamaricis]|uniref:Preprotein translocase subunit YajC n=1 Tax=Evansella tamaricis TaxID=2069301 RepID=A0ABS6JFU7_9BACI|nr:preprotein translocase subunit YajC [Evansella tamaricis]MBU9712506.1 preprotein translocase subunit YajC [Evansella tamaricis]